MKSRTKVILACGLVVLIFVLLFGLYGYNNTWKLWNVPTMSPHFSDLRVLTHGAEAYAQGLDPMIENPGDPGQRRLNYPRVWQSIYLIGVNQSHTTYIGIILILLFLVGVCLVLPNASNIMIVLVMAAVLSPATLLGAERGNIDLLMFFLISVSVVTAQRWHVLSAAAVLLGFVLKLFPIVACTVLLRLSRSQFLRYMLIIFVLATLYIGITYSDILLSREGTGSVIHKSYGFNVFWMRVKTINVTLGVYAKFLSYLAVLLTLGIAFSALFRNDFLPENQSNAVYLDAFRAGSAIYLGTFLLVGTNYDYRLMFLILTIPQLVVWAKCRTLYISAISTVILLAVFLSLELYLFIERIPHFIAENIHYWNPKYYSIMLDDMPNWVVFSGLMYLLFWSMPDWVKEYAQKVYSPTRPT